MMVAHVGLEERKDQMEEEDQMMEEKMMMEK